jgi:DnaJ family protein B protein 4
MYIDTIQMASYYEILGISNDATEADIKKAYRTLSLKYHPDRNPSEDAKEKIQKINEAYETLGDPALRKQYDTKDAVNENLNFGNADQFNDINNIFNMMFNGMNGMHNIPGMPRVNIFQGGRPGQFHTQFHFSNVIEPITKQIELTLEQCYNGCVYQIDVQRTIINNNEQMVELETIYINIPCGINHGETVILHDKGNMVNGRKGPVHIQVCISKHSLFTRSGLDLIYNKTISLKESLCGFTVEINHVSGKRFSINNATNPTVIVPQYKKIVPGLGMKRENNVGNLVIVFDVQFPASISPEHIEILKTVLP